MISTTELLKKLRRIEIRSKGLSSQLFAGEYHSAFKGRGMSFAEVREYIPGDDVRSIDWNVTARLNHTYVKVYEEEREMSVMLLVDISASENYGTTDKTKREQLTELCATIAFSTIQNNDKIGVIFFSDKIEKFIPPKKGKSHVLNIIKHLIEFQPQNSATNIDESLRFLNNIIKKRSTVFLISDLNAHGFNDSLKITARKHDLICLHLQDRREEEFVSVGLVKFFDPESGEERFVDTNSKLVKKHFYKIREQREKFINKLMNASGVDYCKIYTHESFVKPLMALFRKRGGKR